MKAFVKAVVKATLEAVLFAVMDSLAEAVLEAVVATVADSFAGFAHVGGASRRASPINPNRKRKNDWRRMCVMA